MATIGLPDNLRLTGPEAQYAMRYMRYLAGPHRRMGWPPKGLVADRARREQIEAFVKRLLFEIGPRSL